MSERYLDAAMWFGEAVRDEVVSARVVKYVTAIERIVTAGQTKNIANIVATRIADILFDPSRPDQWVINREKALDAYGLRSQIVHGVLSPHDHRVECRLSNCGEIAEDVLVATLFRFGDEGLEFGRISNKTYRNWFLQIRRHISVALGNQNSTSGNQG